MCKESKWAIHTTRKQMANICMNKCSKVKKMKISIILKYSSFVLIGKHKNK